MIARFLPRILLASLVASTLAFALFMPHTAETLPLDRPCRELWTVPLWRQQLVCTTGCMASALLAANVLLSFRGNRQFTAPWKPGLRRQTWGGPPQLGWTIPVGGLVAICVSTWFSAAAFVACTAIVLILAIGWQQRDWMAIDEHGVVWAGCHFRWEQVERWQSIAYSTSHDGEVDTWSELVVEVADRTFRREDKIGVHPRRFAELFREFVPDKERFEQKSST